MLELHLRDHKGFFLTVLMSTSLGNKFQSSTHQSEKKPHIRRRSTLEHNQEFRMHYFWLEKDVFFLTKYMR